MYLLFFSFIIILGVCFVLEVFLIQGKGKHTFQSNIGNRKVFLLCVNIEEIFIRRQFNPFIFITPSKLLMSSGSPDLLPCLACIKAMISIRLWPLPWYSQHIRVYRFFTIIKFRALYFWPLIDKIGFIPPSCSCKPSEN